MLVFLTLSLELLLPDELPFRFAFLSVIDAAEDRLDCFETADELESESVLALAELVPDSESELEALDLEFARELEELESEDLTAFK